MGVVEGVDSGHGEWRNCLGTFCVDDDAVVVRPENGGSFLLFSTPPAFGLPRCLREPRLNHRWLGPVFHRMGVC